MFLSIQSELELACVEINDGHVWKDLNIPSRILKTCSICGVRNVWPWITTIKCKGESILYSPSLLYSKVYIINVYAVIRYCLFIECKMVCHRQCLADFDEKICPLFVNHHCDDLSTISNSNVC